MAKDYKFDPVTGDLVRDGKGAFVLVDTAETALQEQVMHHYRAWWGAPEQGSRLHDLRAFGRDKTKAAQDEVRRALHELEKRGRISNLEVVAEQPKAGRIVVASKSRDTGTGQTISTKTGA
jgi:phage gp46-like protein